MKFPDIPGPPGRTPHEKFMDLVRHVISVPKEELDKQEAADRKRRKVKKTKIPFKQK
jgi:hypothetical protein